jgi:hypothetical protein
VFCSGGQQPAAPSGVVDQGMIFCLESKRGAITNNTWYNEWTFDGAATQEVVITMSQRSGDLDPYLCLIAPDGTTWEDDDGAGFPNAQIGVTLPATGNYTIRATRLMEAQGPTTGDYELSVDCFSGGAPPDIGKPPAGAPVAGAPGFGYSISHTGNNNYEVRGFGGNANSTAGVTLDVFRPVTGTYTAMFTPVSNSTDEITEAWVTPDLEAVYFSTMTAYQPNGAVDFGVYTNTLIESQSGDPSRECSPGNPMVGDSLCLNTYVVGGGGNPQSYAQISTFLFQLNP